MARRARRASAARHTRALPDPPVPGEHASADKEDLEFGGPCGAVAIIAGSHALVALFAWILSRQSGRWELAPTWEAAKHYFGFITLETALQLVMPGRRVPGRVLEDGSRLLYRCNALSAWWATLLLLALAEWHGLISLAHVYAIIPNIAACAMITADALALALFALSRLGLGDLRDDGRSGAGAVYDFFMGTWLNPRPLLEFDIKMWAEIRISWTLLFVFTLASARYEMELTGGQLSPEMAVLVLAHFLYANACQKGEEFIPTTWDIFHERFGWMLAFWNLCGVPYIYSAQSQVLALARAGGHPVALPGAVVALLFAALLAAYYVWDTANSQKNALRMQEAGTFRPRAAFPQLPWGVLDDPEVMPTAAGSGLLVDGWYRYARKPHYTADIVMALVWAAATGTAHPIAWFYPAFFIAMITHRAARDNARCQHKYGADWDRYRARVPWTFVPGLA